MVGIGGFGGSLGETALPLNAEKLISFHRPCDWAILRIFFSRKNRERKSI
jgi:hypothetical protein